jgi:acyl carrier protein
LNIDRQIIGVDSDFFELGGHSLRAARLTARIHKELHVKLPLAEVFKTPMIRGMAQYIQGAVRQRFQAVEPEPKADYYDVSNAQRRLWVLEQFAEAAAAYIMTDWYIFENLNRDAFEKALKTMVKRHEAFRTTFIVIDGEPKQKINHDEECGINIQYMDLKEKQDREKIIDNVLAEVATKPFNLEKGPLLRVKLLYLPGNRCFFAAAMHHIISDGWSMRILRNEVLTLYTAYCHHKENPLPPLRIQYKDFTAWQNRQLQGEALAIHQGFWQECFKDEIPVLNLETDFPRPPVKTYNGSFLDIAVDRETHNGLNVINKKYNTTFIMTLTALLTALLHRYTGQEDIVIGLPVSGRNHSDLENQVGFYINMLPLRVRFKTTDTFENLLNTVKNAILAAFEHQVYPFDLLVEDLGFDRDKSRSPLFDVVMQYVNFEGIEEKVGVEVEGAKEEIRSVLPENNNISMGFIASKFDLVFNFYQAVPLNGSITYNTDIFEKQGIVIMIERLKVVMREIAANPLMRLDQLEFETGIEKEMKAAVESTTFDFG